MTLKRQFSIVHEMDNGIRVRCQAAVCGSCGFTELIRDNGGRSAVPPGMAAKKFRERGWHIGSRERDDECKRCIMGKQSRRRRPRAEPEPVTIIHLEDETHMAAEPLRTATREDRRKINDALDIAYDTDRERYTGDMTDAKLAAQLAVPRAWVSEERDRTFGPEANEADAKKREQAAGVLDELGTLKAQFMNLAEKCEDMEGRVRKLLG